MNSNAESIYEVCRDAEDPSWCDLTPPQKKLFENMLTMVGDGKPLVHACLAQLPKPPEGYRWLYDGEVIRETDNPHGNNGKLMSLGSVQAGQVYNRLEWGILYSRLIL